MQLSHHAGNFICLSRSYGAAAEALPDAVQSGEPWLRGLLGGRALRRGGQHGARLRGGGDTARGAQHGILLTFAIRNFLSQHTGLLQDK